MTTAIKAERLYDGAKTPVTRNGVIVMDEGKIIAAGPASQVQVPQDAQIIDAGDATIMPGMIDAHVHILLTGSASSGADQRSQTHLEQLLTGARNCQLALKSGLTAVRDCGDEDYLSLSLRGAIHKGIIAGPHLLCSGPVITSTGGQLWWSGIECDTEEETRKAVRTLVKRGVDFIKFMGSGGNATPGSNPELSQYPASAYHAIAEDAHRMGKKVAVHVHGVGAIRMAVDAGIDTLEHVPFRANGTIEYDEAIVQDIVRKGLIVSLAMPATWYRMRAEEMQEVRSHPGHLWEKRWDSVRRLHEAGVKLVVSSDHGSTGTRIDELPLLMEFLVNTLELPAVDVLHGVTGLAAEALGTEDRIGTLEPGKEADVLVVGGDPMLDITAVKDVRMVFKSGKVVVQDGMLAV